MAEYDSNMIKPVDSLKNISGLTPVKHREERERRRQLKHQNNENDETMPEEEVRNENDINTDSIGIDYCA
jgi:hypothetical protein